MGLRLGHIQFLRGFCDGCISEKVEGRWTAEHDELMGWLYVAGK